MRWATVQGEEMDDPHQSFIQYLKLSDDLIEQSSKELVADTARLLAPMVEGVRG